MARLIYTAIASLDGCTEDPSGDFGWGEPDHEVHSFINDLEREVGTYLLGRRMYEIMAVWETDPSFAEGPDVYRDFAEIWQAAEKVVYSRTLESPVTTRTRIEREFDPESVRQMKTSARADVGVSGPELAAHAFKAGLVDEVRLFLAPVSLGGGKRALPPDLSLDLALSEERRFDSGMVYLRYEARSVAS
jgi:dihydrofolate reductase